MNVDTMRKIDYFVGVPLCLILSPFVLFYQLFQKNKEAKNVLIIELSEMGSAILVDPALQKLKAKGMKLHFLIFAKNKSSLSLLGTVADENIFTLREDNLLNLALDTMRFIFWCRAKKIDSVIDLELFSRFTTLLTGVSFASKRVGFHPYHNEGVFRGFIHNYKVWYNPHIHIAKNFIALVHALLSPVKEVPFSKVLVTDDDIVLGKAVIDPLVLQNVKDKLEQLKPGMVASGVVLINANASDLLPQRRWSKTSYVELIKMILNDQPELTVLLTGAPNEHRGLNEISLGVDSDRCLNFAGEVQFSELTALYTLSRIMVSNDSGPPHFASTTDIQTVTIFGPETPALYGALGNSKYIYLGLACSPCVSAWNHRKTPCRDNKCLTGIDSARVYSEIKDLI